jgi:cytochrome c-type biogenesis protein
LLEQLYSTDFSWLTFVFVFVGGLASGVSPCTLPTVLVIVGYVGGRRQKSTFHSFYLSLAFVLGIALCLSVLGAVASSLGGLMPDSRILWYVVAVIAMFMGLYMLGYFKFNFSAVLPVKPQRNSSFLSAFLIGIPFGLTASPCTLPVTLTVLAFAAAKGSVTMGFLLLFVYAIGRSLPLLLVGTFTGLAAGSHLLSRWGNSIQKASGYLLVLLGLYFLWLASTL